MSPQTKEPTKLSISYKPWFASSILLVSDILTLSAAFFIPFFIRKLFIPTMGGQVVLSNLIPMFWIMLISVVVLFNTRGLYPGEGRTGVTEFKEVITSLTIAFIFLGVTIFVLGFGLQISRFIFLASWFIACLLVPLFRILIHNRFSLLSWWSRPVVVVGTREDVFDVISRLNHARRLALKPVFVLLTDKFTSEVEILGVPASLNSPAQQFELRKSGVELAVFASPSNEMNKNQKEQLHAISLIFPKIIFVLADSPLSTLSMKPMDFEGKAALLVQYNLLNPTTATLKRLLDLLLCAISLVFTFPLFLVLAFLIRLDSPGPAVFVQKRLGKNGLEFDLLKFRTMCIDADMKLPTILENDGTLRHEYEKYHKLKNDPRVTRIGKFLRKTSLDELPQLWNVIRGEMNLVGPRAYLPSERAKMGEYVNVIHRVAPGLTGWWQVMGRHDVEFESRLKMDEYYISNFSLWMDFFIVIKTVWIVLTGKGA